jgi:PAS domain S-box-containing protein
MPHNARTVWSRVRDWLDRFGLYVPGDAEQDPAFLSEIHNANSLGLRLASSLAIFGPGLLLAMYLPFAWESVSLWPSPGNDTWAIWDGIIILALGVLGHILARTQWATRNGRLIIGLYLTVTCAVMTLDASVASGAVAYETPVPFMILLLTGVGAMPYRPLHAMILSGCLLLVSDTASLLALPLFGVQGMPIRHGSQAVMIMIGVFATGISGLLYAGRWRQHLAKSREHALREAAAESERRFRSLFEYSLDGIFVVDNSTQTFTMVNATFADILKLKPEALRGKPAMNFVHPDDRNECMFQYECAMREENPQGMFSFRAISPALPEPRVCEVTLHRTFDTALTVGSVRDVTRRVKAEEQLRAYAHELELANQAIRDTQVQLVQSEKMASLGTLVAGVAHEINTPLGSINSNADVSRRALEILHSYLKDPSTRPGEELPERVSQALKILMEANSTTLTATHRIVGIVRSLRNFARLDEAEMKEVDIHEGLESTLTLTYHEFKRRIEITRDYGTLPLIWCYPNQINQVFMNILVNAIHAIPEKGAITITTRSDADHVTVAFADTGVGIPPENLKRIFDPGFTTKGVGVGTGLGLSIVYKIVAAHDGHIDVSSEVGKGTTFTITVPVKGPAPRSHVRHRPT